MVSMGGREEIKYYARRANDRASTLSGKGFFKLINGDTFTLYIYWLLFTHK